ncbi:MAG: hypothetical protein JW783_12700 [Bacteroidales bacterium]|nr:hypothetical protein [Bacteroidales bacterium]MBN2749225.1 hypothetical protein [Bacteroidales bacterium]
MSNLNDIEAYYQGVSNEKLLQIAQRPQDLRLDAIPLLQKELLGRGMNAEALLITDFLVGVKKDEPERPNYAEMSLYEMQDHVKERIQEGESIESIKLDLRENGVDIFAILNENDNLKESAFEYMTYLKKEGFEEGEITEKLEENLAIDKSDSEMLKVQIKNSGKQNLTIGYTLAILGSVFILLTLSSTGGFPISAVILIVLGVWRIYVGYERLKE